MYKKFFCHKTLIGLGVDRNIEIIIIDVLSFNKE